MEIRGKTDRDSERAIETQTDKGICPPSALQECNLGSEKCSNTTTPTETALLIHIQSAHMYTRTPLVSFSPNCRHDDRGCVRLAGRQSTKSMLWHVCVSVFKPLCVLDSYCSFFYDKGGNQRSAVLGFTQGRVWWGVSMRCPGMGVACSE